MIFLNSSIQEGVTILMVGLFIVFISLLILFVVFQFIVPLVLKAMDFKKPVAKKVEKDEEAVESGEQMAAIAAAVYAFMEAAHDEENAIVTINKSKKDYSPWSSKIYTTHNLSHRRSI